MPPSTGVEPTCRSSSAAGPGPPTPATPPDTPAEPPPLPPPAVPSPFPEVYGPPDTDGVRTRATGSSDGTPSPALPGVTSVIGVASVSGWLPMRTIRRTGGVNPADLGVT